MSSLNTSGRSYTWALIVKESTCLSTSTYSTTATIFNSPAISVAFLRDWPLIFKDSNDSKGLLNVFASRYSPTKALVKAKAS